MKLRTVGELGSALDQDLGRRKRALTSLKFCFEGTREHQREVVGSAAVCMLYSHWEGFVKFAGKCFANYVSHLGLPYSRLSNGIVATCVRSRIKGLRTTNKISMNRELVELMRDKASDVPRIPWQSSIETYDNLSSGVLKEILTIVGCDPAPYLTMTAFIDERLLSHRNCIAHNGYDHEFDVDDFPELYAGVVVLLEQFASDVHNAAALRYFEK